MGLPVAGPDVRADVLMGGQQLLEGDPAYVENLVARLTGALGAGDSLTGR